MICAKTINNICPDISWPYTNSTAPSNHTHCDKALQYYPIPSVKQCKSHHVFPTFHSRQPIHEISFHISVLHIRYPYISSSLYFAKLWILLEINLCQDLYLPAVRCAFALRASLRLNAVGSGDVCLALSTLFHFNAFFETSSHSSEVWL